MQFVETELLKIGYESGGPNDGPPVLLLHGWPDDVLGFRDLTPHFEKSDFRWVAPYLRIRTDSMGDVESVRLVYGQ